MNREDFPMLKNSIIYFDNAATTFKPQCVLDSIVNYYSNYTSNIHRGDYDISYKVSEMYEDVRNITSSFINANSNEIVFTSGTTQSLNMIINGFFKDYLKAGDEVLLTKAEHASNILPWFELKKEKEIVINYINLNSNFEVTIDNLKNSITNKTKVISIAHITNVIGDIRPIKEIIKYAHERKILVVIDGAQSVPHMNIDVKELDIDFLAFSSHKMCGPTGVGVLYGKYDLLNKMKSQNYGGGMNAIFNSDDSVEYKELPYRLEAGTPNIEGVIATGVAIKYLDNIGMYNINKYTNELKKYAVKEISKLDNIEIYNKYIEGSTIIFNVKDIFPQDVSTYLNRKNICIRVGTHCAKILKDELKITNTCRISLYFYNTKEEIDKLVEALKEKDILKKSIM